VECGPACGRAYITARGARCHVRPCKIPLIVGDIRWRASVESSAMGRLNGLGLRGARRWAITLGSLAAALGASACAATTDSKTSAGAAGSAPITAGNGGAAGSAMGAAGSGGNQAAGGAGTAGTTGTATVRMGRPASPCPPSARPAAARQELQAAVCVRRTRPARPRGCALPRARSACPARATTNARAAFRVPASTLPALARCALSCGIRAKAAAPRA